MKETHYKLKHRVTALFAAAVSKPQLEFLRNASEGHGIIKLGNSVLPFTNLEPKDSDVYQLITTKPGERKKQE